MGIALAQAVVGSANGQSSSARTISLGSNVTGGNFLTLWVATFNNATETVTVSDGVNTWHQAGAYVTSATGSSRLSLWYAYNVTGGALTVTVTPVHTVYMTLAISEYSGVLASSDPLDSTNPGTSANSNNPSTGSVPVGSSGELLLAAYCQGSNTQTTATPTNITNQYTNFNGTSLEAMVAGDNTNVSSATTASWLLNNTTPWATMGGSFKPAATGGPLFTPCLLNGLGAGGPFFANPLG